MTNAGTPLADDTGLPNRLRRLPFVIMLTLGLLLSMIHCAGDLAVAQTDTVAVAMTDHSGASHDLPDQLQPAHSGHCLSHVTTAALNVVARPAELSPRALVIAGDMLPPTRDGLPLFKPPRA